MLGWSIQWARLSILVLLGPPPWKTRGALEASRCHRHRAPILKCSAEQPGYGVVLAIHLWAHVAAEGHTEEKDDGGGDRHHGHGDADKFSSPSHLWPRELAGCQKLLRGALCWSGATSVSVPRASES